MKVTVNKWQTVIVEEVGVVISGWSQIAMFFANVPEQYTSLSLINWKITTEGGEIYGYSDYPFEVREALRDAGFPLDDDLTLIIDSVHLYGQGGLEFGCYLFDWDLAAVEEAAEAARIVAAGAE